MPVMTVSLPDTNVTVTRPVAKTIIEQLMIDTGIPANTKILYPNEDNQLIQPGSALQDKDQQIGFGHKGHLTIEVKSNFQEDFPYTTAVYQSENPFLFSDASLGIYMRPVYSPVKIEISVKFHAQDRNEAERWRNEMRARIATKKDVRLHDVDYYYALPLEFMYMVGELHRLRENKFGYGQDFAQYFMQHCHKRITTITDTGGRNTAVVLKERQGEMQGYFDFDIAPEEGSRETQGMPGWTINFTYTCLFNQPIDAVLEYPLVVHQQFIPARIQPDVNRDHPSEWERLPQSGPDSVMAMRSLEARSRYQTANRFPGYSVPFYDEFIPSIVPTETFRLVTCLARLAASDLGDLFNLGGIPGLTWKPVVLEFMKTEAAFMTQPLMSIFNLTLYEGKLMGGNKGLTIDGDLNIRTQVDLNPRLVYHVRFSVYTDYSHLHKDAIDRLLEHGEAVLIILDTIFPWLKEQGLLPPLYDGHILRKDWDKLVVVIENNKGKSNNQVYLFNVVQNLTIQSHPMKDK